LILGAWFNFTDAIFQQLHTSSLCALAERYATSAQHPIAEKKGKKKRKTGRQLAAAASLKAKETLKQANNQRQSRICV